MEQCQQHSGFQVKFENIEKEIVKIPTLEQAVARLTVLVEEMIKQKSVEPPKISFWDTKSGLLAIKLIFAFLVVLVLALVGVDMIKVLETKNIIP